jgi:hypothetical protein
MYKQHADLELPPLSVPIWRYMSFAKLMVMLQTQRLYFATRNQLLNDDKWEGAYPIKKATFAALEVLTFGGARRTGSIDQQLERFAANQKDALNRIAVSCWHMSNFESAAMWRIYGDSSQAVAIESTVSDLIEAVSTSGYDVSIGEVTYVEPPPDNAPIHHAPLHDVMLSLFRKLRCFTYENELRAAIHVTDHDLHLLGRDEWSGIPVDLKRLIKKVWISPRAQKWFYITVSLELRKAGVDVPVSGSYLDVTPDY